MFAEKPGFRRFARFLLAAALAGGCATDELDLPAAEGVDTGEEPPTVEEQLAEQARRAALVKDVDPRQFGWEADGVASFATPDPAKIDERGKRAGLGTPESENTAVLVLADGRRFRMKKDVYLRPARSSAEASEVDEGDKDPRAQIGIDNRTTVAYSSYKKYPYRTVGSILSKKDSKTGWCTASLIGPRLAITAGHCVYDADTNSWNWNIWFSPGHRGNGSDRFPNGTPRAVVGLVSFHGWSVLEDADHDVGFLILADEPQTASLGWFGFGWWSGSLDDVWVGAFQYPGANYSCAAAPNGTGKCSGFQYWGSSKINDQCGNLLEHQIDTNPGSSGSPFYRFWNGGQRWIIGPHAYGFSPCDDDDNKAVRMGKYKAGVACDLMKNIPSVYAVRNCG